MATNMGAESENRSSRPLPITPWWFWPAAGIFLALLLAPLFLYNMHQGLNHDEHQFVASAWLWQTAGLLPYRDYPYFHFPYLSFLNAALFGATHDYFLTARGAAQIAGWLILVAVFVTSARSWRASPLHAVARFSLAAAVTSLLAFSPLFLFTSGRAWNHDLATLLALLALLACVRALCAVRSAPAWLLVAGLLLGLGIGVRLTLLPLAGGLLAGIALLGAATPRQRVLGSLYFVLGATLALLPLVAIAAQDWGAFWFDNFVYPQLNTLFRAETGYVRAMSLPDKLLFLARDVLLAEPRNLILPAAYLALGIAYPLRRNFTRGAVETGLVALAMPFLLVGALAPTPAWHQYFFILYPFFALGMMWGLHTFHAQWTARRSFWLVLALLVIANSALWWGEYRRELRLVGPERWFPAEVQRAGARIAALTAPTARVLTVAPIYAIEGDRAIYPALATGPFGLRAAALVDASDRARYGFLAPAAELDAYFGDAPPAAILTGADPQDEGDLLAFAQRRGYTPLELDAGLILWVRPLAVWDDKIELAAATLPAMPSTPGETLPLLFYLRSRAALPSNYSIAVALRDQAGAVLVQQDGWPWGRPTSTWQPGELWFDGHDLALPADAAPGLYAVVVRFYDAATGAILPLSGAHTGAAEAIAGYITVGDWPPAPTQPLPARVRFGDHLHLQGYDWAWASAAGDTPDGMTADAPALDLTLHWTADGALPANLTVFVHVTDAAGALVAQQDQPPLGGFYPTTAWQPQQAMADHYRLALPAGLPGAPYTVHVGVYDPATGARAPVFRAAAPAGDSYPLLTLPAAP